ncbi:unnamed protein product [Peniophora sp. CBMAI 1063]|nr:unnamed protein product [Peniophora sp. CBMAI 1063]
MRFGLTRSTSPSPVRRPRRTPGPRRSSTYGLYSSSSESESSPSDDDASDASSSSETRGALKEEYADVLDASLSRREDLTPAERAQIEETVAAIRLRAQHKDPYEEWERQARKDAYHTARREQEASRARAEAARESARNTISQRQAAALAAELDAVAAQLRRLSTQPTDEQRRWAEADAARKARVDAVIRAEEEKIRAAQAEADRVRKANEEEERKAQEAKKAAEEKRKAEEERKRKEEEAAKAKEKAEEDKRRQEELAEQAAAEEKLKGEQERKQLGMTTPGQDWTEARKALKELKAGPIKMVKSTKESKKLWNEKRRDITRRVGQLTNDAASINQVSQLILQAVTQPTLPEPILLITLNSVAKSLILQAETEAVAEPRAAIPLAQVAANLLTAFPPSFGDILFAKLVQRTGGWAVPAAVPQADVDGTVFTPEAYTKVRGRREDESMVDYAARMAGVMRLYFAILWAEAGQPLPRQFHRQRYWAWVARIVDQPRLLATPIAADLLAVALDVGGASALRIWGRQWAKLLALLWDSVNSGEKRVGGESAEAAGARRAEKPEWAFVLNHHLQLESAMRSLASPTLTHSGLFKLYTDVRQPQLLLDPDLDQSAILYYGYVVDYPKALEYAKRHDVLRDPESGQSVDWGNPPKWLQDEYRCMSRIMFFFSKQENFPFEYAYVLGHETPHAIALYTNSQDLGLSVRVQMRLLNAIKKAFGVEHQLPMWWWDSVKCGVHYRSNIARYNPMPPPMQPMESRKARAARRLAEAELAQ